MTEEEFNKKYREYIREGFYGLEFDIPKVTKFLDKYFQKVLININGFEFLQIKLKFGKARFYTNLDDFFGRLTTQEIERFVEEEIDKIIENER